MYFILLFILMIPNILFIVFNDINIFHNLFIFLVILFLVLFPSLFFKYLKNYFKFMSLFLIFLPVEIFYMVLYGSSFSINMISIAMNSSLNEIKELLPSLLPYFIVSTIIFLVYFYVLKRVNSLFISSLYKKVLFVFILSSISGKFFISLIDNGILEERDSLQSDVIYVKTVMNEIDFLNNYYPINEIYKIGMLFNKMNTFKYDSKEIFTSADKNTIVLVIGETARYSNFSLNGYSRQTNPLLEKQDVISFSNFFSYDTYTLASIKTMLSDGNESIIKAYQKAGYKVYWLSNQGEFGLKTSGISSIANLADEKIFLEQSFKTNIESYDEKLLPIFNKIDKNGKNLIILHTMGSHFNYSYRHPFSYDIFKPSLFGMNDVTLTDKSLKVEKINSYDNSILYTDYFLNNIIESLKKESNPSALIYLSDHGENLFDDNRNLFGHANLKPSLNEVHIPFIFWSNKSYIKKYEYRIMNIIKNKDKLMNTKILFNSLIDIANIKREHENKFSIVGHIKNEDIYISDILNRKIPLKTLK